MSLFKAKSLCDLCSYRSIELKQFGNVQNGVTNCQTHQVTNLGLTCTKCNHFVCINCIKVITPKMVKDSKHFAHQGIFNAFTEAISTASATECKTPPNYIGHCCSIARPSRDAIVEGDLNLSVDEHPTTDCNNNTAPLSGCIFFPEFGIFIDSPFDCMDIHAVGAESNYVSNMKKRCSSGFIKAATKTTYLPARWHCVVSHQFAYENSCKSPSKNCGRPDSWSTTLYRKMKIKSPHNLTRINKVSRNIYFNVLNYVFETCSSLHNY